MKVHAPVYTPPPAPPPKPPSNSDLQLASSKARLAFEHAMGGKSGLGGRAQAGVNGRDNRSGAASRRVPRPAAAAASAPAAAASGATPVAALPAASGDAPYAPGSIVNIEA